MASNKQLSLGNHPNSKLEAPAKLIFGEKISFSSTIIRRLETTCMTFYHLSFVRINVINLGVFCGPLFKTFVSLLRFSKQLRG